MFVGIGNATKYRVDGVQLGMSLFRHRHKLKDQRFLIVLAAGDFQKRGQLIGSLAKPVARGMAVGYRPKGSLYAVVC